ncbi:hypothetical protein Anapl_00060, partial [Anas platyrhynchos]
GIALGQLTTTPAPIASTPLPPSATTTSASTPPAAGGVATTADLGTATAVPSADPSTNTFAPALPTTLPVTATIPGITTTSHAPTA